MVPVDNPARVESVHTGIRDTIKSLKCQLNDASIVDNFEINAEKERKLIEGTIKDVIEGMNHVVILKTRLNALAHINRLPEEIFCLIILFTCNPKKEDHNHYWKYTWVCHRWRSILVQNPRFWTVIRHEHRSKSRRHCREDEFYHELNQRSKLAKLDVRFRGCRDFAIKLLAPNSDRIRTLRIDGHSIKHLNIHNMSFSSLRSFALFEVFDLTDRLIDLLPVLAACENLEFLRYTIVDGMRMDQLWSIFRRLKGLNLYVLTESWQLVNSALVLLHNSVKLRYLNLKTDSEDWISDGNSLNSLSYPSNIITLPELRILESDYIFALERIRAPRISYLDVAAPVSSSTRGHPLVETFDFSWIRYLYVNDYSEHDMCLSGSAEYPKCPMEKDFEDLSDDFFDCSRQGFHVQLTISPEDQLQPILSIVIPPSTNLIHLHLLVHFKLYDLEKVLVAAPSIQTLVIDQGGELPNFIQLVHNASILTQLKRLIYCPVAILRKTKSNTYANVIGKTLTACLKSRKKNSVHKLRFIELFNCPALHPSWLKALNELGVEVVTNHRQRIHME